MSLQSAIRKAAKLHKAGDTERAMAAYQDVLGRFPKNKQAQEALIALRKSRWAPDDIPHAQKAALMQLMQAQHYEKLLQMLDGLLKTYPDSYYLWNLMGAACVRLGEWQVAAGACYKAISLNAHDPRAYCGLGDLHKAQGILADAMGFYRKALELDPTSLPALNNLGNVECDLGLYKQAATTFQKAASIAPDNPQIAFNRSTVLRMLNDLPGAERQLKRVLAQAPNWAEPYYNLGLTQRLQGDLPKAIDSFAKAMDLDPAHDQARAEWVHQKAQICDWTWAEALSVFGQEDAGVKTCPGPFPFLAMEDNPDQQRVRSERYASVVFRNAVPALPRQITARPDKLRIGYFSADFHDHATMHLMGGLFEQHDPARFEPCVYSFGSERNGQIDSRIQPHVHRFHDVSHLTDPQVAELARKDGVHVAVDLKGYTGDNRAGIFAMRPAPIQIAYLGYPGTMGSDLFDYVIADKTVLPDAVRGAFSENVIYMPDSYQINDNSRQIADTTVTRAQAGLPEDGFVFCCFNNSYKITPREFDIWMRLLDGVEGSVLWLLRANQWAEANLKSAARDRGIDPGRLIFADRRPMPDHLARHRLADLFLDTFDVNAHTTASDALWSGLPLITKPGEQFAARVAASLLNAAGLPELIAETDQAYEALALTLAQDRAQLSGIRDKMAQTRMTCALFDTEGFVRNLENAYDLAFQAYGADGPREDLIVPR